MSVKKKSQRFDILISPAWQPMLRMIGAKPKDAFVEVSANQLRVKFGVLEEKFPLADVETAQAAEWPLWAGIGPRYVPGTVGLIGTYLNVVVVRFSKPQRWQMLFPLPFKRLFLSLKEPEKFIDALTAEPPKAKAA